MQGHYEARMPRTGESWRHYKGNLYTVIGISFREEDQLPVVVYTEYNWSRIEVPPIYTRKLEIWLQLIEQPDGHKVHRTPRFRYERNDDTACPYLKGINES